MTERSDLAAIRQDYTRHSLSPEDCLADPLAQFSRWLDEALASKVNEPTARHVATVAEDGRPAARLVLLKGMQLFCLKYCPSHNSLRLLGSCHVSKHICVMPG